MGHEARKFHPYNKPRSSYCTGVKKGDLCSLGKIYSIRPVDFFFPYAYKLFAQKKNKKNIDQLRKIYLIHQ